MTYMGPYRTADFVLQRTLDTVFKENNGRFFCQVRQNLLQSTYLVECLRQVLEINIFSNLSTGTRNKQNIPLTEETSTHAASVFVHRLVITYGALTHQLTDSGPQLVSMLSGSFWRCLLVRHLTMADHHPEANGQMQGFNERIVAPLRNYVVENQTNWDQFVQPP